MLITTELLQDVVLGGEVRKAKKGRNQKKPAIGKEIKCHEIIVLLSSASNKVDQLFQDGCVE